jgi:trigger factor
MEELKKNIRHSVEHEKKHEIENKYERALIEAVVAKAKIDEVPDSLVESEARTMLQELEQNVIASGGVFSDYLTSINKTPGAMLEEFKPQALDRVKASLVLRSIVKEEKISVTDEEISKELEMLKKRYAQDAKAMESISSPAYRRHIEAVLLNRAVITKLVSLNTPV